MTGADTRLGALCKLGSRLAASTDLEELVDLSLLGLEELLGYQHSLLLVHQAESSRLVTLATRGYESGGIGSEVVIGEGVIGMAGQRREPMRIGNLQRMLAYARTVQRASIDDEHTSGTQIQLPGLPEARSQLAAPLISRNDLLGVVAVESATALAFDEVDEQILTVAAQLMAAVLDREHLVSSDPELPPPPPPDKPASPYGNADAGPAAPVRLRHYPADGSTFLDETYIIKGVAGRLLWKVASEHVVSGRTTFTNREARLDPALQLPTIRDNFESRLILLKRRLDERHAPLRITPAGRGRFQLSLEVPVALDLVGAD